ncbi:hypothetical protein Syun_029152 [Stephania yunnanensis]|uniref:Uncharacterized protein n=1 Tax=Stephania yunnanensis TaxID=152371 RepID=A0AAP0HFS2_9MAGN
MTSLAIHRVVELRRSRASLSTVVVFHRGLIGTTRRHRAIQRIAAAADPPLLAGVFVNRVVIAVAAVAVAVACCYASSSPQPRHLVCGLRVAANHRPRLVRSSVSYCCWSRSRSAATAVAFLRATTPPAPHLAGVAAPPTVSAATESDQEEWREEEIEENTEQRSEKSDENIKTDGEDGEEVGEGDEEGSKSEGTSGSGSGSASGSQDGSTKEEEEGSASRGNDEEGEGEREKIPKKW